MQSVAEPAASEKTLAAALVYASRGWRVLPVWQPVGRDGGCGCTRGATCKDGHPGKHPIGELAPHAIHSATTDPAIIEAWIQRHPDMNLGIRTGQESGVFVVDIDAYKGGQISLEELESEHGKLPTSLRARTGSGGQSKHILLRHPPGIRIPSAGLKGYPGIDIKADGGYVVAAPSRHWSGGTYAWEDEDDSILEDAPPWLIDVVSAPASNPQAPVPDGVELDEDTAAQFCARYFQKATEKMLAGHSRHDTSVWFFKQCRDSAVSYSLAEAYVDAFVDAAKKTGRDRKVSAKEIHKALEWAYQTNRRDPHPSVAERLRPHAVPPPEPDATPGTASGAKKDSNVVVSIEPVEIQSEDFPEPMAAKARYGLVGEFLDLVETQTEAAPEALLGTFLVMFGNAVCPSTSGEIGPHCRAGAEIHPPIDFLMQVATSSKGRKGTGKNLVKWAFEILDDPWVSRIRSGLSTGEGLLTQVRDPVVERQPIHEGKGRNRKIVDYEDVVTDEGSPDRRIMVIEPEFARTLAAMDRDRNTLSAVLREAWDRPKVMYVMTKMQLRATNASASLLAHCTRDELTARMSSTDLVNGFGNRFLYLATRRTRSLPDGGLIPEDRMRAFAEKLGRRLEKARGIGLVRRDPKASAQWREVYEELSAERPGLMGAITARAEAHVLRLSLMYALTDGSDTITLAHQNAALATWDFCERSARYVFGSQSLGDPVADEILRSLRAAPDGLDRTSLFGLFNRNVSAAAITRALELLARQGLARGFRVRTEAPKPLEVWVSSIYCEDIGTFTELLARSGKTVIRPVEEAAS